MVTARVDVDLVRPPGLVPIADNLHSRDTIGEDSPREGFV